MIRCGRAQENSRSASSTLRASTTVSVKLNERRFRKIADCTRPCACLAGATAHKSVQSSVLVRRVGAYIGDWRAQGSVRRSLRTASVALDSTPCPPEGAMSPPPSGEPTADSELLPLKEACELFERQYVTRVLHRLQWNITGARECYEFSAIRF